MKLSRILSLSVAGVIACAAAAYSAGLFPGFPIVGGATYDSGSGVFVPAGPTIATGNERVAADTQLSQGRAPQTVLLTMATLNALPTTFHLSSPADATTSFAAANTDGCIVIRSTAALSPHTVTLPPTPIDNQQFCLSSSQSIANLTMTTVNSQLLANGAATVSLTVSTTGDYGFRWVYRLADTSWYRLQ